MILYAIIITIISSKFTPMVYHHWAPTSQAIAAAILTFCKMLIFCRRHFLKTSSIDVFPKCS